MKIMVAYSDEIGREKIGQALGFLGGHKTHIVQDMKTGLEMYKKNEFDAVVAGDMYGVNGFEFAKKIREYENLAGKKSYILVICRNAFEPDFTDDLSVANDFFAGPIAVREVLKKINSLGEL